MTKNRMPHLIDYHAYKSTSVGSGNSDRGKGFGCGGWTVIVIVLALQISFIADGASWGAIDTLLGLGLIAFLIVRSFFWRTGIGFPDLFITTVFRIEIGYARNIVTHS